MKTNGEIDAKGLLVKDAGKVANTPGKVASKKFGTRIKELLSNIKIKKMSWKQLLAWGAAIGIGGAALWYLIKENSDVIPEGTPTVPPNPKDDWGPCLNDLLALKKATIQKRPNGEISVYTPPSEKYPGGLNFYSNGRIMNPQTKEMGTWKCVAGKAQTNENASKTQMNESIGQIVKRVLNERYLMEQSEDEMADNVEDMVDYLDVPVWGNDYSDIYDLLKKYQANGKFKQFAELYKETGFNKSDSLRGDIEAIKAIDAKPVLWKRKILDLLDQIESGNVPSTPLQPNTTQRRPQETIINEQNNLSIVWDKDKSKVGGGDNSGGGGGSTTRRTYYDCSSVNIETTPLTYGCKDKKIGEIQGCLGITVDNKFGPNTSKALKGKGHDITNGITKAIYDKVKANCGQTASTQTYPDNSAALAADYAKRNPYKMDLGPVPELPNFKKTPDSSSSEGMTDTQFYNTLIKAGNFNATGVLGRTAYNGPALEPSELEKVNNVLKTMKYYPDKLNATDTGARYVWQKN
jgi:hypothetical protein